MGRGNLSRFGIGAAVVTAAAAAAAAAAGAVALAWSPLARGAAVPNGTRSPSGFLAVTSAQEKPWSARLASSHRQLLAHVDLARTAVGAVFLDGLPCASKVDVTRVVRSGSRLTIDVAYTPPPVGVATCVRTSTPYELVAIRRATLGVPAPSRVAVTVHARA